MAPAYSAAPKVRLKGRPALHAAGRASPTRQAARAAAGVQSRLFGVFHDAGYKGLYGGLGSEAIKARKQIPAKEQFAGRCGVEIDSASTRLHRPPAPP